MVKIWEILVLKILIYRRMMVVVKSNKIEEGEYKWKSIWFVWLLR